MLSVWWLLYLSYMVDAEVTSEVDAAMLYPNAPLVKVFDDSDPSDEFFYIKLDSPLSAYGINAVNDPATSANGWVDLPDLICTGVSSTSVKFEVNIYAKDIFSDSFFLAIDSGTPTAWYYGSCYGVWGYCVDTRTYALTPGSHSVRLYGREITLLRSMRAVTPNGECTFMQYPTPSPTPNPTGAPTGIDVHPRKDCVAGEHFSTSTAVCEPCPAGHVSSTAGAAACRPCPRGSHQPLPGQTECTPTPPGTFASEPGTVTPEMCPSGSFSFVVGASSNASCFSCAAGTFQTTAGATTPCTSLCSAGSYSTTGSSSCLPCAPGYYSFAGAATCTSCPEGTYSPGGLPFCLPCSPGSFCASPGCSSCSSCQGDCSTPVEGAISCDLCPA